MSMQQAAWCAPVMSSSRWVPARSLLPGLIDFTGATTEYARDVEIFGEGEPREYFYLVVEGAVRTYKVLVDGRRQICAFHLRGDYFGVGADDAHTCSAEAIVNCRVLAIKRRSVMAQAENDREVARQLWSLTGHELKRVQAHVLLLIKTAKERVAGFLLEMAERVPGNGEVELPMCRQDIADYLGLTIETVSRMLADLERRDAIALPNSRRVVLRDPAILASCCG